MDLSLLSGFKILEERNSPVNGKVRAVKSLGFGTYIQAEGLTQSGGVVESIWKETLKEIRNKRHEISKVLILGLGGGSAAKLIRKLWPRAEITGVDIDPVMVDLGTKYLGLGNSKTKTVIEDALSFVKRQAKSDKRYDLIIIDLYQGFEYPKKFETENYIHLVRRLLTRSGVAVFNRLYFSDRRPEAMRFSKGLEKVFPRVDYFYPEANVMFFCRE